MCKSQSCLQSRYTNFFQPTILLWIMSLLLITYLLSGLGLLSQRFSLSRPVKLSLIFDGIQRLILLFSAIHLAQAYHFRLWYLFPTLVLCGIGEIIGWSGRLWGALSPYNLNPFLAQSVLPNCIPSVRLIYFSKFQNLRYYNKPIAHECSYIYLASHCH